jgi:hypothetical protein
LGSLMGGGGARTPRGVGGAAHNEVQPAIKSQVQEQRVGGRGGHKPHRRAHGDGGDVLDCTHNGGGDSGGSQGAGGCTGGATQQPAPQQHLLTASEPSAEVDHAERLETVLTHNRTIMWTACMHGRSNDKRPTPPHPAHPACQQPAPPPSSLNTPSLPNKLRTRARVVLHQPNVRALDSDQHVWQAVAIEVRNSQGGDTHSDRKHLQTPTGTRTHAHTHAHAPMHTRTWTHTHTHPRHVHPRTLAKGAREGQGERELVPNRPALGTYVTPESTGVALRRKRVAAQGVGKVLEGGGGGAAHFTRPHKCQAPFVHTHTHTHSHTLTHTFPLPPPPPHTHTNTSRTNT